MSAQQLNQILVCFNVLLFSLYFIGQSGENIKSLAKVKIDNITCSPLIHKDSHLIVEIYQVG